MSTVPEHDLYDMAVRVREAIMELGPRPKVISACAYLVDLENGVDGVEPAGMRSVFLALLQIGYDEGVDQRARRGVS